MLSKLDICLKWSRCLEACDSETYKDVMSNWYKKGRILLRIGSERDEKSLTCQRGGSRVPVEINEGPFGGLAYKSRPVLFHIYSLSIFVSIFYSIHLLANWLCCLYIIILRQVCIAPCMPDITMLLSFLAHFLRIVIFVHHKMWWAVIFNCVIWLVRASMSTGWIPWHTIVLGLSEGSLLDIWAIDT